jgi:hypothetical protein
MVIDCCHPHISSSFKTPISSSSRNLREIIRRLEDGWNIYKVLIDRLGSTETKMTVETGKPNEPAIAANEWSEIMIKAAVKGRNAATVSIEINAKFSFSLVWIGHPT